MDWTDLHNAPKAPEGFHQRLVQTLDSLPDRKEGISMKHKHMTKLLVAAAAIALLATAVFAGGKLVSIVSSSYHSGDYYELPTAEDAAKIIQSADEPKLIETFSNGYSFDSGCTTENDYMTESGQRTGHYRSMDMVYSKDGDRIYLGLQSGEIPAAPDVEVFSLDGLELQYNRMTQKNVPPDYKLTEQDEKDQADGTYVFAWGSDKVEVHEFQHLAWNAGGVNYSLYGSDSALTKDDLAAMAVELMAQN